MHKRTFAILPQWAAAVVGVIVMMIGPLAVPAFASCDVIPGSLRIFRGASGSLDRPFARPGDFVTLRLSPVCSPDSPGFGPSAADNVVSIVFTPPHGARNVVTLATDCAALEGRRLACEDHPAVASATCLTVNGPGAPTGIEVFSVDGERRLRFRFPDSDPLLAPDGDDRTFAGPARVAVTGPNDPLPCELAASTCADQPALVACVDRLYAVDGTCGTAAHADFSHFLALPPPNSYQEICYDPAPPCLGTAAEIRFTTDSEGNLFIPVDWRGVLVGDAVPVARLVRAGTSVNAFAGSGEPIRIPGNEFLRSFSTGGGALPPIFDPQYDPLAADEATLFGTADAPETVLRIARRAVPNRTCMSGAHAGLPCFGAANCPASTCGEARCSGGSEHHAPCAADADCPDGECGPGLFEFRDRYVGGTGPIVVGRFGAGACQGGVLAGQSCDTDADCGGDRCVAYRLMAEDPAPIDGLNQSRDINGFVMAEAIVGRDLNGDGDTTDHVVLLVDRLTGGVQAIGDAGSDGRAVARIRQSPFSFPALALDGDLLAFLESEPAEGYRDANANGQIQDTVLRVYRRGPVDVTPITPLRAIDAAPLIDGRPLAISAERVFVRTVEAALAAQRIDRVSRAHDGNETDGMSGYVAVSGDGRWLAFQSDASNLVPGDDNINCGVNGWGAGTLNCPDIFVRQVAGGPNVRISVTAAGTQANGASLAPSLSYDGRFVAFYSKANNLVPGDTNGVDDVFVVDRDADGNGIFDEPGPGMRSVERISVSANGFDLATSSTGAIASISADGRFVAFASQVLEPGDAQRRGQLFVRDRLLGITERVSVGHDGNPLPTGGGIYANGVTISGDGRFVAFVYGGDSAVPDDTNGYPDAFVRDRLLGTTERVSVANDGSEADGPTYHMALSADGRFVAFSTWATNLTVGITNHTRDVFVRDRVLGTTGRVSVGSAGEQGNIDSEMPAISGDGRFVAFRSQARNLVPGTSHSGVQTFRHDRLTGLTQRLSNRADGAESAGGTYYAVFSPSISSDGRVVAFHTDAADLVEGDDNPFCDVDPTDGVISTDANCPDVFVYGADPTDPLQADLSGDDELNATVLEVVDAATGVTSVTCPAGAVSVAGGNAAFLRPESAGTTPGLPHCPTGPLFGGRPDLNGDGDASDEVVHLWRGGSDVRNLRCAASAVWLSATHVAALVSEAAQGEGSLNTDADTTDHVVLVHALADPPPASCAGWQRVGPTSSAASAAVTARVVGATVALLTAEVDEGVDLNGDGDLDDTVLQVFDASTGVFTNTGQAAEDFVLGQSLLAFRTSEASQGGQDLNGDGDAEDDVLQVLDLATTTLHTTGQAVTPCRLEACDPRQPYRVLDDTVKFLTFEADQGEDLNGNGTMTDLVLQVFNARLAANQETGVFARKAGLRSAGPSAAVLTIGAVNAGICTTTAEPCNSDVECAGGGACFVPPGGCLRNLGNACNPAGAGSCGVGKFCQPATATCFEIGAACRSDADCPVAATCAPEPTAYRIVDPFAGADRGGEVFIGSGHCVDWEGDACATDVDCGAGRYCDAGQCARLHGPCAADTDCPQDMSCQRRLVVSVARDSDHDEIADPFDNCPGVPNVAQEDADADGVGDACECAALVATKSLQRSARVGKPDLARLKLKVVDAALRAPVPGSPDDPRQAGAELVLTDPNSGMRKVLALPAAGWSGLGRPAGSRGYAFRARDTGAPCDRVKLLVGKRSRLEMSCRGAQVDFAAVDSGTGRLLVQLALGGERLCMQVDGAATAKGSRVGYKASGPRPLTWPP